MASFDMIVRAFFADGGLSAGLAKANAAITQVGKSGPGARAGLKAVETGARALAFEAAGLAGPMGRISAGLLQIGGGSAAVLGAVAGIGAIALAYNLLTKESREAAEAEKKHREELLASARARAQAAAPQTQVIGGQTQDARAMLADADRRRQERVAFLTNILSLSGQSGELADALRDDAELRKIDQERADLSLAIALNRGSSARAAADEAKASERDLNARRALRLEAIQFLQAQVQLEKGGVFPGLRRTIAAPAFGGGGLGIGGTPLSFANIRANEPRFVAPDTSKGKADWLKTGQVIAQGFFQSVTAFKAGGPGGILGGVGALASAGAGVQGISKGLGSALSLVGFAGSALGGIFSLFDNSEERRHKELLAKLDAVAEEVGLERVTVVFTGPDGHQVRKSLAELESGDAVERVPGPAGATG